MNCSFCLPQSEKVEKIVSQPERVGITLCPDLNIKNAPSVSPSPCILLHSSLAFIDFKEQRSFRKKLVLHEGREKKRERCLRHSPPLSTARSCADWSWDPKSSQEWGPCVSWLCFSCTSLPISSLQLHPGFPRRQNKAWESVTLPGLPPSSVTYQLCGLREVITSNQDSRITLLIGLAWCLAHVRIL